MKNKCEVCSKIFYSDGNTCNECATKMDGVDRNKYDYFEPDIKTSLTPEQIASMSEVVAKYIGYEFTESYDRTYAFWTDYKNKSCVCDNDNIPDWNILHKVWEKVRAKEWQLANSYNVQRSILEGTPIEAFTALYNAIIFINQLKITNNENNNI